jgi:Uma2 family endonuclease
MVSQLTRSNYLFAEDNQPETIYDGIVYPYCDGEPMANSTEQFDWIVIIKQNLEELFAEQEVFIAGDLFWYPVRGKTKIAVAPDVMVVFGRPKGHRRSYIQFREQNIPPQVVIEILSHTNTKAEMERKFQFFDQYGVEEYYVFDPNKLILQVWLRDQSGEKRLIEAFFYGTNSLGTDTWISPNLGIRFAINHDQMQVFSPNGDRFLNHLERKELLTQAKIRAELDRQAINQERVRADLERQAADQERVRAELERQAAAQERIRAELERQTADRARERADLERQIADQQRTRAEAAESSQLAAIAPLVEMGLNPDQIALALGLDLEIVQSKVAP